MPTELILKENIGMNTMTLNIDIPQGVAVDAKRLTDMATRYVQHYIYMLQRVSMVPRADDKSSLADFKSLRGILQSDKSYKEMVEEAIADKYENLL